MRIMRIRRVGRNASWQKRRRPCRGKWRKPWKRQSTRRPQLRFAPLKKDKACTKEAQARPTTQIKRHSHAEVSPRRRNSSTHPPQETKPKRRKKNSRRSIELKGGSAQQRALSESTRSPLKRKNQNTQRCEDCFERSRSPLLRKCEARKERQPKPIGRSPQLRKAEARVEVEARMGK